MKTRIEQYMKAIKNVQEGIDRDDLEYALNLLNAAIWIKDDLERQVTEIYC